jgi:hypothetical protein
LIECGMQVLFYAVFIANKLLNSHVSGDI